MVTSKFFIVPYGLTLLPISVSSSPLLVAYYFQRNLYSRDDIIASTVNAELGPQLSNGSLIFGSNNSLYDDTTTRWNTLDIPDAQVVVQPAIEGDNVQKYE